jgi:sarcosine oxidase
MPKPYDVIVLGLGAMGSASVYQLAKKGSRVLGIDQFSPPHSFGSSHGETRVIRQAIGEGAEYVPLVLRSYELWRQIEASTGRNLLHATGGLIMAKSGSRTPIHGAMGFLNQTATIAKAFGIRHSLLSATDIKSQFPQFSLAGDEEGYYEPEMGYLRPELCVHSQLVLAEQAGAMIRRNEKVLDVIPAAGEVCVKTTVGQYTAGRVVIAAGSWIARFLGIEWAGYFKVYRQTLYWFDLRDPVESYVPGRFPVFIWELGRQRDDFVYGFPAIDGRAGGIKVASEQHVSETDADLVDRTVTDQETDTMYRRYVRDRLPGLSAKCLKAVACLYTSTPDSGFVIDDHPSYPNILIVSPCSGHGFKHSAAIGEVVAELITAGRSRIDVGKFKLNRFSV